ncbi:histidine phosphatase superfamily [Kickxella alabastrina]|uniref:histidine phosphatase superfamily n=1 Tax=Kickxella alabastrina TaxID=61397 RepID=UPI00221ECBD8|nr:histidine phosphatase superfamily [Kickxella alabastrina]KAI7833676.1 histidine phosphatase superfamily [Kickxella alabastrina]
MTKIELIIARHGETSANARGVLQGSRLNFPLNDLGRKQANALAEGMKSTKIDWIISWGILDGVDFKTANPTLKPIVQRWISGDFDAKIPEGDSANECKERILHAFADILREAKAKQYERVLVCIHGRIMRVIMSALVDRDLRTMERFTHTNCCYHQIKVNIGDGGDSAAPNPRELVFETVRIDVRDHLANLPVQNREQRQVAEGVGNL